MVDNRAETNTGEPDPNSETLTLNQVVDTYLQLSADAYAGGDTELGALLGQYAFGTLAELEAQEATAELEASWPRFQEMLVAGYPSTKIFDAAASASTIALPHLHTMLGIDLGTLTLESQSDKQTVYSAPMELGMRYIEVHSAFYGRLSVHVERPQ